MYKMPDYCEGFCASVFFCDNYIIGWYQLIRQKKLKKASNKLLQGFNVELWLLRYKYIFSKLYVI